jgi:diacylglycerol kinase family enzyme
MKTQIAVVYNAKSGSSKVSPRQISSAFSGLKVTIDFYSISKGLEILAGKLKDKKYNILVAAGGDGTVNICANYATMYDVTLGVLPMGTLNHFSKDAGIPQDLTAAAHVIANGTVKKIDYASVDDKVFVNNASIGIYPTIVIKRESLESKLGKWPAAVLVTIASLFSNTTKHLTVDTPSASYKLKTSLLFVGNNSYQFDKIGFSNRSKLNTGKLYLYVIRDNHPLALVSSSLLTFFGFKRQQQDILQNTVGPIVVRSKKSTINVTLDGEVFTLKSPVSFSIYHRRLRLIIPK